MTLSSFGSNWFNNFDDIMNRMNSLHTNMWIPESCPMHDLQKKMIPKMDVHCDDSRIQYQLELPGMTKEDITINEENGVVTVSGNKRLTHENKRDGYHSIESKYGKFSRSFSLPENAEHETLKASFENGLLNINVELKPKNIETSHRSIPIA